MIKIQEKDLKTKYFVARISIFMLNPSEQRPRIISRVNEIQSIACICYKCLDNDGFLFHVNLGRNAPLDWNDRYHFQGP